MNQYWYDHNPSLTLFYKTIILLEKSYQTFIDDALISMKYRGYEYRCDDSELLLDKNNISLAEDFIAYSYVYLTKKQRILLCYKINSFLQLYFNNINQVKMHKQAYSSIQLINNRLKNEQELLDKLVGYNKFADILTDCMMKIIIFKVKKQWHKLMHDDFHGYHSYRKTKHLIKL